MSGEDRETTPGVVPLGMMPTALAGPAVDEAGSAATAPTLALLADPLAGSSDLEMSPVSAEEPGRYILEREHARGGQARVLVAHDTHVGRRVAWKELLPEWQEDTGTSVSLGYTRRFLREARITAGLEHPNICPVHEIGRREDGRIYYTMRLVRGETLADRLERCSGWKDRQKLLGAFWDVCNAIAYAHGQGVIHRDLKPGNVMVGSFGETVVLDWGLAKHRGGGDEPAPPGGGAAGFDSLESSSRPGPVDATLDGAAMGTPWYMSPEQARGAVAEMDERSDVWGLGAVLYEILTGRPPVDGSSIAEVLAAVMEQEVVPVRERCPEAPAELEGIAMKCLARARAARYQSASELAEDIAAYMTGERVSAHEYTFWDLVRRFAVRHRTGLVAALAVLMVIVTSLVVLGVAWRREAGARRQETAARLREKAARLRERDAHLVAEHNLSRAHVQQAIRLVDERQLLSARVHALAALAHNPAHPGGPSWDPDFLPGGADSDRPRMEALSVLYRSGLRHVRGLIGTLRAPGAILGSALSRDGSFLAVCDQEGRLTVWRLEDGARLFSVSVSEHRTAAVVFSPDGRQIAVGGSDSVVRLRDAATGAARAELDVGDSVVTLAWSPDGLGIVSGHESGAVRLWSLAERRPGPALPAHSDEVRGLAFSPDGARIATGSWDKTARIIEAASGKVLLTLKVPGDGVYQVSFSPDGARLATASYDGVVRLWDVSSGEQTVALEGGRYGVIMVAFSGDGRWLASGGYDRRVRLWDVASGSLLAVLEGHTDAVHGLGFSPAGTGWRLVSASQDKTVQSWRVEPEDGITRLFHPSGVYGMAWSPDGARLATSGWDRAVRIFDRATGAPLRVLEGHTDGVVGLAFSPDGRTLASCGYDRTIRVWDLADGRTLRQLVGHEGPVLAIRFSPDGTLLASVSQDRRLRLWDPRTGRLVHVFEEHGGFIHGVAFSPDGRRLATAGFDRRVRLFDVRELQLERTLEGHADWVSDVEFSPDGRSLVTVGKDRLGLLWNTESWRVVRRLEGHRQWVNRAVFSPDGRRILTGGDDGIVFLWDVATGNPLLRLDPGSAVTTVAIDPLGRAMAVGHAGAASIFPLELPTFGDIPAALRVAEEDAGARLVGFELMVTPEVR